MIHDEEEQILVAAVSRTKQHGEEEEDTAVPA